MTRFSPRRALALVRLIDRRARGVEPGDDALSRLRFDRLAPAPRQWLGHTLAKLAVVLILAALVAGVFTGGIAAMKALGLER
ncbi:hypothetical protein GXW78_14550 [Roseomonas terrae]|jgi:hypothetical protein|uniref:Uncharacterized protein n=1 Tax=Neoroseomonas terrae TaxID=424799 RepID=A0ABS5EIN6_9PROT|nr:hypothetical protein [Neoroseomonas terrae]MBR0650890.1 hypothetical protein [Neoroseomonas terrae]